MLFALQLVQMRDLEWLAPVADEQLRAGAHRALMHAEHAEAADERIDADLEHVRDHVTLRVGRHLHALGRGSLAFQERRRIAFHRVRHQPREYLQQLLDAGAALGGNEADGNEMPLAERLLKRVVELLRRQLLALLEVQRHQLLVDLDHLVDDLGMRGSDRIEVGLRRAGFEEAVDDAAATVDGKIHRQALAAERFAQLRQHLLGPGVLAVDLVHDDQPAQLAVAREFHHALRDRLDAVDGADDDRGGFHRFEHAERAAGEVGITGRIEQVDATLADVEVDDGGVERMPQLLFLRIEVAHRRAALEASAAADCAGLREQGLGQQRLAGPRLPHQRNVADICGRVRHGSHPPARAVLA